MLQLNLLIGALNDNDSGVRLRAIQALEETKDPRAISAIKNSVILKVPDRENDEDIPSSMNLVSYSADIFIRTIDKII